MLQDSTTKPVGILSKVRVAIGRRMNIQISLAAASALSREGLIEALYVACTIHWYLGYSWIVTIMASTGTR